jgi:Ice-binding-like
MKNYRFVLLLTTITAVILASWPAAAFAATDPLLATAGNFAVLGATTVTNTGPSWITGQLGVFAGTAVTGFPPGVSGVQHNGDGVAGTAQTDLTGAFTRAGAGTNPCPAGNDRTGINLGGLILGAGVYCQTTAPTLTGTLTLTGPGVYIFQIGSTLITANNAVISLVNGALPCDVFWRVGSSATIAPATSFVGNIMALTSITMQTGATLNGRALASGGAVTLDTNRIIQPTGCGFAAPTAVSPPAGSTLPATLPVVPSPTPAPTATPVPVALPNTGGPPQQPGFPWLPAVVAGAIGALLIGLRRRTHKRGS